MILPVLNALLCAIAGLLLIPVTIFVVEVAAGVVGGRSSGRRIAAGVSSARPSIAILIPAHDEEAGIRATLRSIIPQLVFGDRLLVIADNCSDGTRSAAEAEGAEVISRTNSEKRGKGYALDFGLQALKANPPSIVLLVDADCHVAPAAIDRLTRSCALLGRPVQAQYLMQNKEHASLKMRVAEFAWMVKNLVRPLGLAKLGLPCQLMGSGMAFPWPSISRLNLADGHLVEDMKMGLDLARLGVPPAFCVDALVSSSFPTHQEGIKSQRTRWEHGHLGTILNEAPKMLVQGLRRFDRNQVAMAADLCVPPLALLLLQVVAVWVVAAVFFAASGHIWPLLLLSTGAAVFGLAVLGAWAAFGSRIISFSDLVSACLYPLAKIPMYLQFVFSRQSEWVRSKRDNDR